MQVEAVLNPFGAPIYYHETLSSTMDESRILSARGEPHGTVVVADYQEAGRGRIGRPWKADRGKNLFFTILLRYPAISSIPQALTLRTGLALSLAIEDFAPELRDAVKVKWPNDIMIDSRKAVGILTETDGKTVYIGIGVNVAQTEFPEALRAKATSILLARQARLSRSSRAESGAALSSGAAPCPDAALSPNALPGFDAAETRFILLEKILAQLYGELSSGEPWRPRLEERLYMKGRPVRFIAGGADSGCLVEGTLAGIGEGGEILIIPEGQPQAYAYVTGELQVY
jgi:BirA family biotin operon repressor/biotin-[acetyl-CoA-carboxylase] ligase